MSNNLDSRRFPLNKEQYKLWEQFVADNYETIYNNKDTHEVRHTPNSLVYAVTVSKNEQSGMQEFLEGLVINFLKDVIKWEWKL